MVGDSCAISADAICADPDWLPYRVRDQGRTLQLVRLSRDQLTDIFFVDERSQPNRWQRVTGNPPKVELPLASIAASMPTAGAETCHYIFHGAFCCSTLMSRALDIEGVACVVREPRALHELAQTIAGSRWSDDDRLALEVILGLLRRPRPDGEKTIIKPANLANPFIDYILEHQPHSRALLMHSSLEDFVMTIARRRRWSWARNLAAFYRYHLEFETRQTRDLLFLTDLQMAAFLWLQYQAQFTRLVRDQPPGRISTLRADAFVAQPVEAITSAAAFFGLPLDKERATALTESELFTRDAKRPSEGFDAEAQKRNDVLLKLAFGPEIQQAIEWGEAVAAEASIPLELPAPLIG